MFATRNYANASSRFDLISKEDRENMRRAMLNAISERAIYEQEQNSGEKTVLQLHKYFRNVEKLDAYALDYAVAASFDPAAAYNRGRMGDDRFNIYAISKVELICRVLRGGSFDSVRVGDGGTVLGVVKALLEGQSNGKTIGNIMCDYINSFPREKAFGSATSTQMSSSLCAMEVLGIVRKASGTSWQIADRDALECLARAGGVLSAPVAETASNDAVETVATPKARKRKAA